MLNDSNYPSRAKDILLDFFQSLFSQERLYSDGNDFIWNRDEDISNIYIGDNSPENLMTVQQKPSLVITRGTMQWSGQTIGSSMGDDDYKDMVSTDMTINCFSKNGLEAEFLASLVFQMLKIFKKKIRKDYEIHKIDVMGLGQESLVEGDSVQDLSVVPVFCRLMWNEEWTIDVDAIQLNRLNINGEYDNHTQETSVDRLHLDYIKLNPSRVKFTNDSPLLKEGLKITIVDSSGGEHDGIYRLGPKMGDHFILMQSLSGETEEDPTDAVAEIESIISHDIGRTDKNIEEIDSTPKIITIDGV